MKTLSNLADRQNISLRLTQLSTADTARWGLMTVHQMVCHLDDSYKVALAREECKRGDGAYPTNSAQVVGSAGAHTVGQGFSHAAGDRTGERRFGPG